VKLNPEDMVETLPSGARVQLKDFEALLLDRAVPLGMVSARDRDRLWARHVLDSVRGVGCLPEHTRSIVDVGSGAGLPGIPVAICRPDLSVALLEPKSRRAGFLELVVDTLGLRNVSVVVGRATRLSLSADLCLARAVATPTKTWQLAHSLLRPGGRLLLWAGRSWPGAEGAELERLGVRWKICSQPGFSWEGPLVIMGGT